MKAFPILPAPGGQTTAYINRREAIRRMAILLGGAVIGTDVLLLGDTLAGTKQVDGFTEAHRALLDEIGETIVPATSIPGAKAAGIGAFMTMFVTDCYNEQQHRVFMDGLVKIDAACRAKHGTTFLASTPAQRTALANDLDAEQRRHEKTKERNAPQHYFRMMKDLTLLGYFSSEIGCTQALRYTEVPGAYHGDVPYQTGDRGWYV